MSAAATRERDAADRALVQAWHTAALFSLAWAGKMPDLRALLARGVASMDRPSVVQQRARLALVGEHLGIPPRPISPEAAAALRRLKGTHGE